ncbi:hypothetical protein [Natronospira bacteriovora]|uniref:Uncharacterized protein n=1 Tax=Natronospira bacteriovora TaxID=3069753 RepID=A0ABU0W5B4_9GAMM|nr:hypothetical protein [Natronospira sp. AB-CW4]MDQ2069204.1 hypothetical protein [Natronospira sp. AB-CW4]
MELKEFITETLTQIVDGVSDAKQAAEKSDSIINPAIAGTAANKDGGFFFPAMNGQIATLIDFDVSLSITEGKDSKAGINVASGLISLGGSGQSSSENSSLTRVRFNIPVVLQNKKLNSND